MCVCVCMCMHVCVYVCMYVCMYVCVCNCMCVCVCVWTCMSVEVRIVLRWSRFFSLFTFISFSAVQFLSLSHSPIVNIHSISQFICYALFPISTTSHDQLAHVSVVTWDGAVQKVLLPPVFEAQELSSSVNTASACTMCDCCGMCRLRQNCSEFWVVDNSGEGNW